MASFKLKWTLSAAFLFLPAVGFADFFTGYDYRFGLMSPNKSLNTTASDSGEPDPTSYRSSSNSVIAGYGFPWVTGYAYFGDVRWNDEGALIPLANPKLSAMNYGAGVSLGLYDHLQIYVFGGKSLIMNHQSFDVMEKSFAAKSKLKATNLGAMLTGNRVFKRKGRDKGDLVLLLGVGLEDFLSDAELAEGEKQLRMTSVFFTFQFHYLAPGDIKRSF